MKDIKTKIDELKKIRGSTFVPKENWSFEECSHTVYCDECGNEVEPQGYVIKSHDEHQAVNIHLYGMKSICQPQAKFIAAAANNWDNILEALEIACEALEYTIVQSGTSTNYNQKCNNAMTKIREKMGLSDE